MSIGRLTGDQQIIGSSPVPAAPARFYSWLLAQLRAALAGAPPFASMAGREVDTAADTEAGTEAGTEADTEAGTEPGRWVFTLPALWRYCAVAAAAAGVADVPASYPAFRQALYNSSLNRDLQPAGRIDIESGSGKVDSSRYVLVSLPDQNLRAD